MKAEESIANLLPERDYQPSPPSEPLSRHSEPEALAFLGIQTCWGLFGGYYLRTNPLGLEHSVRHDTHFISPVVRGLFQSMPKAHTVVMPQVPEAQDH